MNKPSLDGMLADKDSIISGFEKIQKVISSKYFYDTKGSELFDQITNQDEYYPTSKEINILKEKKEIFSKILPNNASVIEFGSGSSKKIINFLKAINTPKEYFPVDISEHFLKKNLLVFSKIFPLIKTKPVYSDFFDTDNVKSILNNYITKNKDLIGFFPGSTIGNFKPSIAKKLLKKFSKILNKNNYLVIGVDLLKNKKILEKAYNDKNGITKKFNLNILDRLNNELDANFIKSNFEHLAFFNNRHNRIEMHILSKIKQTVRILNKNFKFRKGETIHTENSYKYSIDDFNKILQETGFKRISVLTDCNDYFGIFVYRVHE